MIVSEIFYGVQCDRCGELYSDGEHAYWNSESSAVEDAYEADWIEQKNKHYCPDCYDYDEEKDENIIRDEFPPYLKELNKFLRYSVLGYCNEIKEQEDCFLITKSISNGKRLKDFEENYIRGLLRDNLISIEYKQHERYTRQDCLIRVKK